MIDMNELKQEAIKKAYGEHYDSLKNSIDKDGWTKSDLRSIFGEWKISYSRIGEPLYYRPNSLRGIENNNGWTRIESDDWLKVHEINGSNSIYFINNINEDYFSIAVLVTQNNIEYEMLSLKDYLFVKDRLKKEGIVATHYQPISKPNPPIY